MRFDWIVFFAILRLIDCSPVGFWHVIDPSVSSSRDSECREYENNYQQFDGMFEKYRLWKELASAWYTPNSTIYGSQYTLQYIWNHQHPQSCQGKKFMISANLDSGFGSQLHVLGLELLAAIRLGVILVLHPLNEWSDQWKLSNPLCANTTNYHDCYYEPISSCTIYDALGPDALNLLQRLDKKFVPLRYQVRNPVPDMMDGVLVYSITGFDASTLQEAFTKGNYRTIYLAGPAHAMSFALPELFQKILKCSPIKPDFYKYWWRAMSLVYLLRPNTRTLQWINQHQISIISPYQSIYVRRGDKYLEMKLIETKQYFEAAELVFRSPQYHENDSRGLMSEKRRIFLGTEDPHVLEEFQQWSKDQGIDLSYTNLFNRSLLGAGLSKEERERPPRQKDIYKHHPDEYLSMILNIYYLIRGNGYVCTLASNFCRVIDELRAFYGYAQRPYADLSPETCSSPPCLYANLTRLK